jgi:hypothetical protein
MFVCRFPDVVQLLNLDLYIRRRIVTCRALAEKWRVYDGNPLVLQPSVRFNSRVNAIAIELSGIESVLAFSVFEAIAIADKREVASEKGSIPLDASRAMTFCCHRADKCRSIARSCSSSFLEAPASCSAWCSAADAFSLL